jgi:hypothetical protein
MRKIINNLREQPEEVRHHVVHLTVAVAGVILVVLWLFSLGGTIKNAQNDNVELSEGLKPFSVLSENLADGYQSLGASAVMGVE